MNRLCAVNFRGQWKRNYQPMYEPLSLKMAARFKCAVQIFHLLFQFQPDTARQCFHSEGSLRLPSAHDSSSAGDGAENVPE